MCNVKHRCTVEYICIVSYICSVEYVVWNVCVSKIESVWTSATGLGKNITQKKRRIKREAGRMVVSATAAQGKDGGGTTRAK